jgi:hypothetical protein
MIDVGVLVEGTRRRKNHHNILENHEAAALLLDVAFSSLVLGVVASCTMSRLHQLLQRPHRLIWKAERESTIFVCSHFDIALRTGELLLQFVMERKLYDKKENDKVSRRLPKNIAIAIVIMRQESTYNP